MINIVLAVVALAAFAHVIGGQGSMLWLWLTVACIAAITERGHVND